MAKKKQNENEYKDPVTSLIWCTKEFKPMQWKEAITFAKTYKQGKYRLATMHELLSLVDYTTCNPSINKVNFPKCKSLGYWSATSNTGHSYAAWNVDFYYGDAGYNNKNYCSRYIRLVRNK